MGIPCRTDVCLPDSHTLCPACYTVENGKEVDCGLRFLTLSVSGGNKHTVRLDRVATLQDLVSSIGAEAYPQFLRIGGVTGATFQPVGARGLLREVETFSPKLAGYLVPSIRISGPDGTELGTVYPNTDGRPAGESDHLAMWAGSGGIRLTTSALPPPVGFRSHPGLEAGQHECYFARIERTPDGWRGHRAPGMGGSGAPVPLPDLPVPLPTRWDVARTAGKPDVALLSYLEVPAPEVFVDVLHVMEAACLESMRLKQPLTLRIS